MDMKFYVSLFMRRLPYFLIFLAVGSALGITLARVLPPVYQAQARLLLESEVIEDATTVVAAPTEIISSIEQRILARNNLIDIAREHEVYATEADARGVVRIPAEDQVADMRARINIRVEGGAQRRGSGLATFVLVSFEAPNGVMSAGVTNEIVDQIRTLNQEFRKGVAAGAAEFRRSQVDELDQELTVLGQDILEFQEANINALPDSLDFRRDQLTTFQARLVELQRGETALVNQRAQLVAIYESTGGAAFVQEQRAAQQTPEARQLQRLKDERDGLLATLSPTHPRVRQIEGQIASLEARVDAQAGVTPDEETSDISPGQSAYELRLGEIDAQIVFVRDEQARIEVEIDELERSIEATYNNSAILRAMQRRYDNIQAQYNQAVAELAEAEVGETIEALERGGRITVVEQAFVPSSPQSPNRPLIAIGGIAGGLFVGLAFIVLLELLNSSIRRPVDLTNRLGITPLGAVPRIRTRGEIFRRRAILAGSFATVLIALPAALYLVHTEVMPLDRLLSTALSRVGLT